jgi:nucleotide-binding universal stress UspA family protein
MIKILVAVDGSNPAERAVKYVIGLSKRGLLSRVLLLNVQPDLPRSRSRDQRRVDMLRRLQSVDEAVKSSVSLLERAGVPYKRQTRSGAPAEGILKCARKEECSAIVMGTRGLGAVAGLVLGSVAMKVVQLARVPVTLVK